LGQKQTLRGAVGMSALPPKADIGTQSRNVRFVPKADSCAAAILPPREHWAFTRSAFDAMGAGSQSKETGAAAHAKLVPICKYIGQFEGKRLGPPGDVVTCTNTRIICETKPQSTGNWLHRPTILLPNKSSANWQGSAKKSLTTWTIVA
jgi:hypothetical protein